MVSSRKLLFIVLGFLAIVISGCSSGGGGGVVLSSISGEVSYEDLWGQPAAPDGVIVGIVGSSQWDTTVSHATGAYKIDGIPVGSYQVVVKGVMNLPSDTTFLAEPAAGWRIQVESRIPWVGFDFSIITLPAPPQL